MENDKLISASALANVIRDDPYIHGRAYARVRDHIDNAPDAVKHGRWIQKEFWNDGGTWRCSECGRQIMFQKGTPTTEHMYYCPECGTTMDGGNSDG